MTADLFSDLLELFSDEDLIRFTRRAEIRGMLAAAEVLRSERDTREIHEDQQKASAINATPETP